LGCCVWNYRDCGEPAATEFPLPGTGVPAGVVMVGFVMAFASLQYLGFAELKTGRRAWRAGLEPFQIRSPGP